MRDRGVQVRDFRGIADHMASVREPAFHAEDECGRHDVEGSWQPRRGMENTDFAVRAAKITAIAGWETVNGTYAYLAIAGTTLYGE